MSDPDPDVTNVSNVTPTPASTPISVPITTPASVPWDDQYTCMSDIHSCIKGLSEVLGIAMGRGSGSDGSDASDVYIMVSPSYMGSCMYMLSPDLCECRMLTCITNTIPGGGRGRSCGYTLMSGCVHRNDSNSRLTIEINDLYLYDGVYTYPPNSTTYSDRYQVLLQFISYGLYMEVIDDCINLTPVIKAYLAVEGISDLKIKKLTL